MWEARSKWKTLYSKFVTCEMWETLEKQKTRKEKLDGKYFTKMRKQKKWIEGTKTGKNSMVNILPCPFMEHE